jgi:mono/diheme cytochrome c family protein
MRLDVEGTVARGELRADQAYFSGKTPDGEWVSSLPLPESEETARRGQQRFGIYCAPCHGFSGKGDGTVATRAAVLAEAGKALWVAPTNLSDEKVAIQPYGQIFNTISNGLNTMPGYKQQIPVADRWAIAFYLKALQRTQILQQDP